MSTDSGSMDQSLVSHSQAGVSPSISIFAQPQWDVLSLPALRGFADGFVGGLMGGLLFCLVLAWFQFDGLELAGLRVAVLSLVFGGFEAWRVTRGRTLKSVRASLLWTLAAGALVLWALGAFFPGTERTRQEAPAHFNSSRLELIT
jgi:hypothetical protein